jgi:hypothetical protein
MTLLALTVAISTLAGWVPWPADLLPAAQWVSVAALVCYAVGVVDWVVQRISDR